LFARQTLEFCLCLSSTLRFPLTSLSSEPLQLRFCLPTPLYLSLSFAHQPLAFRLHLPTPLCLSLLFTHHPLAAETGGNWREI